MNKPTIFEYFTLDGMSYYYDKYDNHYYIDNSTIRERITLREFKDSMMICDQMKLS
jgi:hypothetical protein